MNSTLNKLHPLSSRWHVFMCHVEERLSDDDLIPSYYKRYVDDTLAIIPGLDAAESFLNVLNGLHPSIHFTMELSNNDSIPFIGTLITKDGNKLETQVYRKPMDTGLLLHFQSHTDLRYKKCLIKTMVHQRNCPLRIKHSSMSVGI